MISHMFTVICTFLAAIYRKMHMHVYIIICMRKAHFFREPDNHLASFGVVYMKSLTAIVLLAERHNSGIKTQALMVCEPGVFFTKGEIQCIANCELAGLLSLYALLCSALYL